MWSNSYLSFSYLFSYSNNQRTQYFDQREWKSNTEDFFLITWTRLQTSCKNHKPNSSWLNPLVTTSFVSENKLLNKKPTSQIIICLCQTLMNVLASELRRPRNSFKLRCFVSCESGEPSLWLRAELFEIFWPQEVSGALSGDTSSNLPALAIHFYASRSDLIHICLH